GRPGMEAHTQQADHGKSGRDQQALDQLQHPDSRRGQCADHVGDAFEAAMMKSAIRIALAMVAFVIVGAAAAEVLEPDSYRSGNYRAPTPATLHGAAAIDTPEAEKIWRSHAATFIDVLPRPPR